MLRKAMLVVAMVLLFVSITEAATPWFGVHVDSGGANRLDQIGKRFGLSRERVRQIEREVMGKLRTGDRADRLRAYAS